jgi:hypothetical protein
MWSFKDDPFRAGGEHKTMTLPGESIAGAAFREGSWLPASV